MPSVSLPRLFALVAFGTACSYPRPSRPTDTNHGCTVAVGTTTVVHQAATAATVPPDSAFLLLRVRDVVDESGVEGGVAMLLDADTSVAAGSVTDREGVGRLAVERPGRYLLRLRRLGYVMHTDSITLRAGHVDTMAVTLGRGKVCMWVTPTPRAKQRANER